MQVAIETVYFQNVLWPVGGSVVPVKNNPFIVDLRVLYLPKFGNPLCKVVYASMFFFSTFILISEQ